MSMWPALLWGLFSGSALLLGAAIGWFGQLGRRSVGTIMAFGSGILVAAVAFDLMDEGFKRGGLFWTAFGFLVGATLFTLVSVLIDRLERGRSETSAFQVIAGTVIDGIPESIVIGLSLIEGRGVALAAVIAIFLSNIPEALSSTSDLKKAGRSAAFVFALWALVTAVSGIFSLIGFVAFDGQSPAAVAFIQAVAAGALLAMIADTMIPEAFAETHEATGLVTALGFLAGFALSHGLAG